MNNNQTQAAIIWTILGATTFTVGLSLWAFIAASVTIAGLSAALLFGTLAATSAAGIGGIVAMCAQKAKENFSV